MEGSDAPRAKQLICEFVGKTVPTDQVGELAKVKKNEWQEAVETFVTAWGKNYDRDPKDFKELYVVVKPALATMCSMLFTMNQLSENDVCIRFGEILIHALGAEVSNAALVHLLGSKCDKKLISEAVTSLARQQFCQNSTDQRKKTFNIACPNAGVEEAACRDIFMQTRFDEFNAKMTEYLEMYKSVITPLQKKLQTYIDLAWDKEGKEFLVAFTTQLLKEMSSFHKKMLNVLKHMRDANSHFALGWDMDSLDDFRVSADAFQ